MSQNAVPELMPLGIGQLPKQAVMGFVGEPRNFRFHASRGVFLMDDDSEITEKLTVIPLAFRLFHAAELFQSSNKRWVEMAFLDQLGNICQISWHGWSVENFLRAQIPLSYQRKDICDVAWTLTPVDKTNKKTKSKYFMLEFAYKQLDDATKVFYDTIRAEHKFCRTYTLILSGVTELASKNWHNLSDQAITADIVETKALPAPIPGTALPQPTNVPMPQPANAPMPQRMEVPMPTDYVPMPTDYAPMPTSGYAKKN